jgi:hypothetical protein
LLVLAVYPDSRARIDQAAVFLHSPNNLLQLLHTDATRSQQLQNSSIYLVPFQTIYDCAFDTDIACSAIQDASQYKLLLVAFAWWEPLGTEIYRDVLGCRRTRST